MLAASLFLCFFGWEALFGLLPVAVPSRTCSAGVSPASSCFLCSPASDPGDFSFSAAFSAVASCELLLADSCSLLDARLVVLVRFFFCVLSRGLFALDRPLVLRSLLRRLCLSALRLLLRWVSLLLDRRFLPESLLRRRGLPCLRLLAWDGNALRDLLRPPLVSFSPELAGGGNGGRSAKGLPTGACGGNAAPPYAANTALGF